MNALKGKVAIVTGGGSGIGAATAEAFAHAGARVLIVGRTRDRLVAAVEAIGSEGVDYCVADVSKEADTERYVAEAVQRFGGVDILVGNAAVPPPIVATPDCSVAAFDEVLAVGVRGVWLSYRAVLPELARRGGGSVVFTASIASLVGVATMAPYIAAKHAVLGLARTFAQEAAPLNVRVNAVCPGLVETAGAHGFVEEFGALTGTPPAEVRAMLEARIPMKRWAEPAEIARLILFLASEGSSYTTGAAYVADGGVTAGML